MGLPLHPLEEQEFLDFIGKCVREKRKASALYLNIHGAVLALNHPWLFEFYRQVDLVFCDGDGIRLGLKLLGQEPPPKITLTRSIWRLAEFCEKEGLRLFLLGASPQVAAEAARRLKEKNSERVVAGFHDGYFQKSGPENDRVISAINQAKPDLVVVCFGMPIQEKWIMENSGKLEAKVLVSAGGVLDYVAGSLGKAPDWMIRLHLEWMFRVWQEPGRLLGRYLTEIPYFFYRILLYRLKK